MTSSPGLSSVFMARYNASETPTVMIISFTGSYCTPYNCLQVICNGLPQLQLAGVAGVMGLTGSQRTNTRLKDRLGCGKVRFADTQ